MDHVLRKYIIPANSPEASELWHMGENERFRSPSFFERLRYVTSNPNLAGFGFCTEENQKGPLSYTSIHKYLLNGQAHADIFEMQILDIAHVILQNEPRVEDDCIWLWHGTQEEKLESIMQQGLQPPNRFGRGLVGNGIYFADRASKSAQYCYKGSKPGDIGYLLLCRVFVGRKWIAKKPINTLTGPPTGYDSIHCIGQNIPEPCSNLIIQGDEIPLGETIANAKFMEIFQTAPGKYLQFNEYVVFKSEQVQIKYLVKFRFAKKPSRRVMAPTFQYTSPLSYPSPPKPVPLNPFTLEHTYPPLPLSSYKLTPQHICPRADLSPNINQPQCMCPNRGSPEGFHYFLKHLLPSLNHQM